MQIRDTVIYGDWLFLLVSLKMWGQMLLLLMFLSIKWL